MVEASWLFLMTDVECLYTSNPRANPDAKPIHEVNDIRQLQVETGSGTQWGCGGMATKLTAARLFTAAGGRMVRGLFVGTRSGKNEGQIGCQCFSQALK